jgi:hypothetical protein
MVIKSPFNQDFQHPARSTNEQQSTISAKPNALTSQEVAHW